MEIQTTEEGEEEKDGKSFLKSSPTVSHTKTCTCYLHRYVHASTSENRLLGGCVSLHRSDDRYPRQLG